MLPLQAKSLVDQCTRPCEVRTTYEGKMDFGQVGEVQRMCHIVCMELANPHLGLLAPERTL